MWRTYVPNICGVHMSHINVAYICRLHMSGTKCKPRDHSETGDESYDVEQAMANVARLGRDTLLTVSADIDLYDASTFRLYVSVHVFSRLHTPMGIDYV